MLHKFVLTHAQIFRWSLVLAALASGADAQSLQTLYSFTDRADGAVPLGVIADAAGNLYGATQISRSRIGGVRVNCGTVFELPASGGFTVLHTFGGPGDGCQPSGSLVADASENFYGVTGAPSQSSPNGSVYKLAANGAESILHNFQGGTDGDGPTGNLLVDAADNIYGVTVSGGGDCSYSQNGCGSVFKLASDGTETILHSFAGPPDGFFPVGGLTADASGMLYGVTLSGGTGNTGTSEPGCGTVYTIAPDGSNYSVLYSFQCAADGSYPAGNAPIVLSGVVYGTTTGGGYTAGKKCAGGCGVVFAVPTSGGTETVVYAFQGGSDGKEPSGLILGASGNFFGTSEMGGTGTACVNGRRFGCGTVFKLTPDGSEAVLHSFQGTDGSEPFGNLVELKGALYGTSLEGGAHRTDGTIFQLEEN